MRLWICAALALLLSAANTQVAQAQDTDIYCLRGGSQDGTFYYWLYVGNPPGGVAATNLCATPTDPMAPCSFPTVDSGDTSAFRQAWFDSINAITDPANGNVSAALDFTDPYCPGWDTAFSLSWTGPDYIWIGASNDPAPENECVVSYDTGQAGNDFGICQVSQPTARVAGALPAGASGIEIMQVSGQAAPPPTSTATPRGRGFAFAPPQPNPMLGHTQFRFRLSVAGAAELAVFDLLGRRVRILVDEPLGVGDQQIAFDGRDDRGVALAPGQYLARLVVRAGGERWEETRKITLLR